MTDAFDDYKGLNNQKTDPSVNWYDMDSFFSDSADLPHRPLRIRVETIGTLICIGEDGVSVTFNITSIPETLKIRPIRIGASSTATNVKGLY